MYTDEDLDAAVEHGIFSSQSVSQFRTQMSASTQTPAVDEENFRLISGFNDIFVLIACMLLMVCAAWVLGRTDDVLGLLVYPVLSWGLAEFFVRKRKMALPAIVLLLSFVGGVFALSEHVFHSLGDDVYSVATALSAIAAYLHWRRFRVPITVAAGVAALFGFIIAISLSAFPALEEWLMSMLFIAGLMTFAIAMIWDASDTKRLTHRSDVAFWLHLLSAPMIAHPVFNSLGILKGSENIESMIIVIALYVVMSVISIVVDRRAFMVSSLGYVLYAISKILEVYGDVGYSFAVTGVAIGAVLLLLSAFWRGVRVKVLGMMPSAVKRSVPAVTIVN